MRSVPRLSPICVVYFLSELGSHFTNLSLQGRNFKRQQVDLKFKGGCLGPRLADLRTHLLLTGSPTPLLFQEGARSFQSP